MYMYVCICVQHMHTHCFPYSHAYCESENIKCVCQLKKKINVNEHIEIRSIRFDFYSNNCRGLGKWKFLYSLKIGCKWWKTRGNVEKKHNIFACDIHTIQCTDIWTGNSIKQQLLRDMCVCVGACVTKPRANATFSEQEKRNETNFAQFCVHFHLFLNKAQARI